MTSTHIQLRLILNISTLLTLHAELNRKTALTNKTPCCMNAGEHSQIEFRCFFGCAPRKTVGWIALTQMFVLIQLSQSLFNSSFKPRFAFWCLVIGRAIGPYRFRNGVDWSLNGFVPFSPDMILSHKHQKKTLHLFRFKFDHKQRAQISNFMHVKSWAHRNFQALHNGFLLIVQSVSWLQVAVIFTE